MNRDTWSHRLWVWSTGTQPSYPLRLGGLSEEIPWEKIPHNCIHLDLTGVRLDDVSRIPSHIQHIELGRDNHEELPDLSWLPLRTLRILQCPKATTIGALPPTLEDLEIAHCVSLRTLPKLPLGLKRLTLLYSSHLESLPVLPESLETVVLTGSGGTCPLPFLPARASCVLAATHFALDPLCPRWEPERVWSYLVMDSFWDQARELSEKIRRYQLARRTNAVLKEELMMATWHPTRVARWLDAGEDVLDMMMGT